MRTMTAELIQATEAPFERARVHTERLAVALSSAEMTHKPHSDLEALVDAEGREWARLMLEDHLAMRAQLEKRVEVTGADGVERTASRDSLRHLETIVGTVAVPRTAYQSSGADDLHPMDASLNLPRELFSHGVRRMVAKEVARASLLRSKRPLDAPSFMDRSPITSIKVLRLSHSLKPFMKIGHRHSTRYYIRVNDATSGVYHESRRVCRCRPRAHAHRR